MESKSITYKTNINSYKHALSLCAHRLNFDLDFRVWGSKQRTKLLSNKFNGKCIILCNGPSLNRVDFDLLKDTQIFTIGLNKINLMFEKNSFRPNLISCVNPFVIDQNIDFYLNTDIPVFLDYLNVKKIGKLGATSKKANIHYLHSADVVGQFATDLSGSICQGYTVTYVALQIAYHLGFTKVALVGCDHNFSSKGVNNSTITQTATETNHFMPNYFAPGSQWQLPDLLGSEFHYQIAKDVYEVNERVIYNCTEGGKLEIFERIPLDDFIKNK